jgi:hypothetical protein
VAVNLSIRHGPIGRPPSADPAALTGTGRAPFETAIDEAFCLGGDAAAQRLVYADWLDEWCDPASQRLANAQRWLAAEGKRPRPQGLAGRLCDWWSDQATVSDPRWQLPHAVFQAMPGSSWYPNSKDYADRLAAETALAEALMWLGIVA